MKWTSTAALLALAACSNTQNDEGPGGFVLDAEPPPMRDASMPPPPMNRQILINEISSETDFIEVINLGMPVDLGGWQVADDAYDQATGAPEDHIWTLAPGVLATGELLVIEGLPFGLGGADGVRLFDPEGRVVDAISWEEGGAAPSGCRLPDGTGDYATCQATPGEPNQPLDGPPPEPEPQPESEPEPQPEGEPEPEPGCGDGLIGAGEVCDGATHAGRTCEDFGLRSGTLRCADDCQRFETDGCLPADAMISVVLNEISSVGDDFIELRNLTDMPVDLAGWAVADSGFDMADPETADARYALPEGASVPANGWLVLIKDVDHPFGIGKTDGIRLFNAAGQLVDQTEWVDGAANPAWCRMEDGTGPWATCGVATPGARNGEGDPVCGNDRLETGEICDGDRFASSCEDQGFSGGELACSDDCRSVITTGCTQGGSVVLNEITSAGDDAIEIFNGTADAVDLTGWAVSDSGWDPAAPEETAEQRHTLSGMLPAGGYKVLIKDEDHLFGVGREDAITLWNADGAVVDTTAWPENAALTSWCRQPNGTGDFQECAEASFGAENP